MARRKKREGSIQQLKNGKWRCRITDAAGKRISHTAATYKEAVGWVRNTADQVEKKGLTYDSAKVLLSDYLSRWLSGVKSSIKPLTYASYRLVVQKYLIPAFGNLPVKDLKADNIRYVYDGWLQEGIGAATMQKIHRVFRTALKGAKETGLVYQNVTDSVKAPKAARREMLYWSDVEANRFLTVIRDHRLYGLFYLAIVTGARQMELLGLQWSDLDWIKGTLHIGRQLVRSSRYQVRDGYRYADIKTRAGNRTIKLGAATLEVLREHMKRQDLDRKFAGRRWQHIDDLIFTSTIGTPLNRKNLVDRDFIPMMEAAGVKKIRFHDLRHTAVAIMLSNGKSIFTVSKYIGHARPSITSDIYGHLIPGAGDDIGQMMDDLVFPTELHLENYKDAIRTQPEGQKSKNGESGSNDEK